MLTGYHANAQIIKKDTTTQFDPTNPTHLIVEYEEASQSLQTIRSKLLSRSNVEGIRSSFQAIQSRLDIYQRIGGENLEDASLSRLNDIISIFERQLNSLEGWQQSLLEVTKELSDYKIELYKHTTRLTLDQSEFETDFQKEYYETRHTPLINQADSLNRVLETKLKEVLDLEYNITEEYAQLYGRTEQLKTYVARYWDNMMKREEIIWTLDDKPKTVISSSTHQFTDTVWRVVDFFNVNRGRVVLLILVIIGCYFLLQYLRKQDLKRHEDHRHTAIYQNQLAASLLIGGLLFPVIFPPTTSLMYDFALLASYIPFLYILNQDLDKKHFRNYAIFFVFLLVLKIQDLFSGTTGYVAIVTAVCGLGFLYILFIQPLRKHYQLRWKWVVIFTYILAGTIVIGLISILFGRVSLALVIINGSGETLALGLILLYFGNWFDQLFSYLSKADSIKSIALDKTRLSEFWTTWNNRVYLLLLLVFVVSFLKNFNLYTSAKDSIISFFTDERVMGELTYTYGGIALFLVVIYLASKLSSAIKFLSEGKSYYKSQKETANMAVVIRFFLVTVGFLLALLVSGIPIDRITIILGALSVGIGFGLQNIVNNLISGIILIFERPIQTGDLVELQQYTGFVKDIGIRSSVIRTYEGAEVIVPNGHLVSQEVINWTLSSRDRRVEMRVGVAYGSDVKQVIEIITGVLQAHDKVISYPAPAVLLDGFGDSSVDFRCLIWTNDIDNWLKIKSELSTDIYNALNEANITIPFPQRDIHVVSWEVGSIPDTSNNIPEGQDHSTEIEPKNPEQD